jgi:hypothetical protein
VAGNESSYLDFFRTRGNVWRLSIIVSLGIISQYSGNALFSNYMNVIYEGAGITTQNQKLALSTGKTILDIIVTIAAATQVDNFGRRRLFLVSTCGEFVLSLSLSLSTHPLERKGKIDCRVLSCVIPSLNL